MNNKFLVLLAYSVLTLLPYAPSFADDAAAEITPKGLQFKLMPQISIEREDLLLSVERISVSMQFKNHADTNISTVIAFPIPEYVYAVDRVTPDFKDFTVEVNGKPLTYQIEIHALVDDSDYTSLLQQMHISIQDFGAFEPSDTTPSFFDRLPAHDQATLIRLGLVDTSWGGQGWPKWTVSLKYYWTQTFPANSSLTITHHYSPYSGYEGISVGNKSDGGIDWQNVRLDGTTLESKACLSEELKAILGTKLQHASSNYLSGLWVSYVLRSALNWKQPIKLFHLTVEKKPEEVLSTCISKNFKETAPNRFEVTFTNYIPDADITVFFLIV